MFDPQDTNPPADAEKSLDRIDELVSSLVDEMITDEQARELEGLLVESADARRRYIENVQLHVDLVNHFRPDESKQQLRSPVLGFLGPEDSGVALPPVTPTDPAE